MTTAASASSRILAASPASAADSSSPNWCRSIGIVLIGPPVYQNAILGCGRARPGRRGPAAAARLRRGSAFGRFLQHTEDPKEDH
ncbi:hypothetical protein GCM10009546_44570 [Actinomadura livida]|uniref:Uncharacterized protein n=1 Tax=Actinomadura livida TaxID=79909 RepID=A0ABN1EYM6_9ACTN|nr:hypothetical protein GCM10010208_17990 [Actinomadura livida]